MSIIVILTTLILSGLDIDQSITYSLGVLIALDVLWLIDLKVRLFFEPIIDVFLGVVC
jgi:hypothetical protein